MYELSDVTCGEEGRKAKRWGSGCNSWMPPGEKQDCGEPKAGESGLGTIVDRFMFTEWWAYASGAGEL